MIFHPTEPRVLAVLDWELSTLGHPLADFAYHAMMYHMPPHIVAGLGGVDVVALGIPGEEEYVAAYCRRTGRSGMPDYRYYQIGRAHVELQSLMRISYAVFCLKKKKTKTKQIITANINT